MKIKLLCCIAVLSILACGSCGPKSSESNQAEGMVSSDSLGGPQIGEPITGAQNRPAPSPELQALIDATVPKFTHSFFLKEKNDTLQYNLFVPSGLNDGEKYPLVLFMADATTPGPDVLTPLIQGYGGLVWAAPEFQKEHPCFVLVPQYSYVTVNNEWQTMPEVDQTIELLYKIAATYPVDSKRIYTTGQSMGCMMSLYFNIKYPDLFAASLFVSGQWDVAKMEGFKDKKFIYITAGGDETSTAGADQLKTLLEREASPFAEAFWSARLPEAQQDSLASVLLSKGDERNFITFEGNTVLPEADKNPAPVAVHMASFNYAYKLKPVTEWLLNQSK